MTQNDTPPAVFQFFVKFQNPFMKWLLRSPLHMLVSGSFLLITFSGRKSGRIYTTPVQYNQNGDTLTIITSAGYIWWKNLRDGAAASVVLRGKKRNVTAHVHEDIDIVREAVSVVYPVLRGTRLNQFTQGKVAILLTLES